jgi:predicted transcriptional regulator
MLSGFAVFPFNLITTFTTRPAIRLRHTRIIRHEEKKVAMKIRGLFKLNEITSIQMPKIRMDRSKRKEIKIPHHQIKGFIRMLNFQKIITFYPSQGATTLRA